MVFFMFKIIIFKIYFGESKIDNVLYVFFLFLLIGSKFFYYEVIWIILIMIYY